MNDDINKLLHTLWGKAVGTVDYDKKQWSALQLLLERIPQEHKPTLNPPPKEKPAPAEILKPKPPPNTSPNPLEPIKFDSCIFDIAYFGRCGQGNDIICDKHLKEKCYCGKQAIKSCANTSQFVCGTPLCQNCECRCRCRGVR